MFRTGIIGVVTAFVAALLACGCARTRPSISAPPTQDELAKLEPPVRSIAANVGVEGEDTNAHVVWVVPPEPIKLTEEEKHILGLDEAKNKDDLLAFYHPQRGPEHGVYYERGGVRTFTFGIGGAQSGRIPAIPSGEQGLRTAEGFAQSPFNRRGQVSYPAWWHSVRIGPRASWGGPTVEPRSKAGHLPSIDH